jgi:hypothetical protein
MIALIDRRVHRSLHCPARAGVAVRLTTIAAIVLTLAAGVVLVSCASDRSGSRAGHADRASDQKYETPGPHNSMPSVMQAKLAYSQGILEGLAMGDFHQIDVNASSLYEISQSADWLAQDSAMYFEFSQRFRTVTKALSTHARANDLAAASNDYADLVHSCVACHSYMRKERMTKDMPGKITMR